MSAVIQSLAGQYGAALSMLRSCVERADGDVWHAVVGKFPYWHITYHVLHATDLYLSPDEATFRPQPFHREGYELLGAPFGAPDQEVVVDQPYDRGTLAVYVDTCRAKTKLTLRGETEAKLGGPSGFSWLEFCRLELHLYNIRHIQHHTGQLVAALRRHKHEGFEWALSEAL